MKGLLLVASFVASFFMATSLNAQVKVHVISTADDSVGSRLVFGIREGIRRSSGMELVGLESDALVTIRIVTIDPSANTASAGSQTVYSMVVTAKTMHETPVDMYLENIVGHCGARRVSECADGLVADTDKWAGQVAGWIQQIIKGNE